MAPSLRIHGGEAKGRRLTAPAGIRPSQGLVKEAIFNLLGSQVVGAQLLDLYAGSGALGLEALSRGGEHVTFVEREERQLVALRRNIATLGYGARSTVVRAQVERWLQANPEIVSQAMVIFLDPPYNDPVLARTLQLLDRVAGSRALLVVEHDPRHQLPPLARLQVVRDKRYGGTQVTLLQAEPGC
jgi:16S rRNA (guanine966-N2)-methyltransferase